VVLLRTCAIDPYDGIDPLVRALWLGTVQEAFSLSDAWAHGMQGNVLALLAPAAVGLIGMAIAIARTQGEARLRWVAWTALSACTLLVASLRIGYGQTALVTTAFGALALIDMIPAQRRALRLPCAVALSPLALAALLPERAASPPTSGAIAACNRPDDARGLAALPPGLVLAPIDQGAFVLAFTPHRALAAPYHRNNAGNRLALLALREPAEDALALLRAAGVDYVAACGEAGARTPLLVALDGPSPPARVARVDALGAYRVWRIDP
jgi:hypothetical protein